MFLRRRRRKRIRSLTDRLPIPDGLQVYGLVDWPGTRNLGSSSGVTSSTGIAGPSSQSVSHQHPGGGSIEVGSHFYADYEDTQAWAPINMLIFEARKPDQTSEEHLNLVRQMSEEITNGVYPWFKRTGTVDGDSVVFSVVSVGNSFAAVTQLPDNVVALYSRGVPLVELNLESYG